MLSEIRELNEEEINYVSGGIAPVVIAIGEKVAAGLITYGVIKVGEHLASQNDTKLLDGPNVKQAAGGGSQH
jgi:lactobin A/cerein 7B family class IIb bacteriocin